MYDQKSEFEFSEEEISNINSLADKITEPDDILPILPSRVNFLEGKLPLKRFPEDSMGRRRHETDWVLNYFKYRRSEKMITKENTRIMMMRAFNKAIRLASEKKIPKCQKLSFDPNDEESAALWRTFARVVSETKLKFWRVLTKTKSFNDAFCKRFFKDEGLRKCYFYFVEFFFASRDPEVLCSKLLMMCCENSIHYECLDKWEVFKDYVQYHFIQTLEIKPFYGY